MKYWLPLVLLAACHREADRVDAAPPVASADAAPSEPPVAIADLRFAFWTHEGNALAVSDSRPYLVSSRSCAASKSVEIAKPDQILSNNGADRFVVRDGGAAAELWDAKSLSKIALLPNGSTAMGGAVSSDGTHVALTGCAGTSKRCGTIFDGTMGAHIAPFSTSHDLDSVTFSETGKYLLGRSDDAGLTVFDVATGKAIVLRMFQLKKSIQTRSVRSSHARARRTRARSRRSSATS